MLRPPLSARIARTVLAALAAGLLAACAPSSPPDQGAAALAALPACDDPPAAAAAAAEVPGLVLPEHAIVTDIASQGPLTQVSGYVAMTPLEVRAWYEDDPGEGVRLLSVEDEVFEAELLLSDQDRRMYLRALALCADGSGLEATVAPAGDADALPTPRGLPTRPPAPASPGS